jgi:hypothetical protein
MAQSILAASRAAFTASSTGVPLLRGMAVIKGMIAIAAVGAVFWRMGWRVSRAGAAAYLVASWALTGSTMIIWQLSFIVPAALVFHAAALSMLLISWRER